MDLNINLLQKCYDEYMDNKKTYDKMYDYYKGNTDAIKNYKMVSTRNNNKINTNFIQKMIKEEVSYSVGNDITYISKDGDINIVNDIDYYLDHWSENHDTTLAKNMIIYSTAYELYYIDKKGQFSAKIISPNSGYAMVDDFGNISFFMHFFKLKFNDTQYIDVYTNNTIYHFDDNFKEVKQADTHIFGVVPLGIAILSEEGVYDSIYTTLKGLQDAYETNLSDISNEISDFRNAYLTLTGVELDEEQASKMKEMGIIQVPNTDGTVSWLIKNINDSFIQNTLSTLEDKIYQLSSHINHNEKMQSNLSGVVLRSRLISLEEKCKLNQRALADCIKTRLELLFVYLKIIKNKQYDYRDIKIKFTPNIPQDDLATAQLITQMGDKMSIETGLSLLSFIENPANEIKKIKSEKSELLQGQSLLDNANTGVGENGQL